MNKKTVMIDNEGRYQKSEWQSHPHDDIFVGSKKKVVVWNVEVKWIWPWFKCYVHCFTPHHSANSIYHDFHILVTAFLIGLAAAVFHFFFFRSDWARGKSVWAPSRVREIKSDCVIFD